MRVTEINDQSTWDSFLNEAGSPSFLQSWEWGELSVLENHQVLRLGVYEKETLTATALVLKIASKKGKFMLIPHGPTTKLQATSFKLQVLKTLTEYLVEIGKKEKYIYIRTAPIIEKKEGTGSTFTDVGYVKAPMYMHAESVWKLALDKPEEQLLGDMRKTTRYLIKKAQKDGVVIEKRTDSKAVDDFWEVYKETFSREGFTPFSKQYIQHEFETFNKTGNAVFLFGQLRTGAVEEQSGKTAPVKYLAAALILFTKSTGFYHQGASIHSKVPVPYLLQWEAIKEAKNRGCEFYNFWGIAPDENNKKHPWAGLTLFKKGFGGEQIDYVETQDYVLDQLRYIPIYLYEKILRWKRKV